ncbi:MAG TPA: response regulator [Candidatus Polarisedimenticolaceae bacterium]|nr:response regulator [Candidatus Polarisedimenticolaceae bacterium]
MLVRCPRCRAEIRIVDYAREDRVVKYLCPSCSEIVRIDLEMDEVASSSSSGSYRSLDRHKTVLVADDTDEVLERASELLGSAGFLVLLARDGEEALQTIREEHPDLVVLDLLMPRMTGFDVLRELRADERVKDTPVLVMSGVYKENILDFLHQIGASGFLDKQQLEESLIFRVQALLAPATP